MPAAADQASCGPNGLPPAQIGPGRRRRRHPRTRRRESLATAPSAAAAPPPPPATATHMPRRRAHKPVPVLTSAPGRSEERGFRPAATFPGGARRFSPAPLRRRRSKGGGSRVECVGGWVAPVSPRKDDAGGRLFIVPFDVCDVTNLFFVWANYFIMGSPSTT